MDMSTYAALIQYIKTHGGGSGGSYELTDDDKAEIAELAANDIDIFQHNYGVGNAGNVFMVGENGNLVFVTFNDVAGYIINMMPLAIENSF